MDYQKTCLPNGIRIVTSRMPHVRSATVIVYVGVGSRYESDRLAGISHFLEHMLFKGTERRPDPVLISEAIEGVGGMMNASTGREHTDYWVKVPSRHLELAFDVLADMLRHSLFDLGELEKERHVIVEEIHGIRDTPDDYVHDLVDRALWNGHPLGRPIIGSEETVEAITRDELIAYLEQHYRADRLVVAAAGDLTHEQVIELVQRYFGDLEPGTPADPHSARLSDARPTFELLERPTEQAHLCLALPALPYRDERRFVQGMLDSVLSSGMSSRLFKEIRERQGLAYEVYGYLREYADVGQAVIYTGTDVERAERALRAVRGELEKLVREPVPDDELERTKELRVGRIVMGLEDSRAVASWIGGQELVFGEVLTPEEVIARIRAVTSEEIQALAQELFQPERFALAVIGPFADVEPLVCAVR
ncbi:MAG: insulinase family protein [Thermomicrobium sp.]|jgi:predicted Zn-dependent peptidase|uniref:M16 family metallopeptidase n=1 Tax=Thermomicrobium sp. TaxID=1969469 RepID=UPI001B1EA8A2|nr:pitrilysin family protein [Thermomicrobium sp.]MBO9351182.1 insulinase family protein [Thermomicrobium sp.]